MLKRCEKCGRYMGSDQKCCLQRELDDARADFRLAQDIASQWLQERDAALQSVYRCEERILELIEERDEQAQRADAAQRAVEDVFAMALEAQQQRDNALQCVALVRDCLRDAEAECERLKSTVVWLKSDCDIIRAKNASLEAGDVAWERKRRAEAEEALDLSDGRAYDLERRCDKLSARLSNVILHRDQLREQVDNLEWHRALDRLANRGQIDLTLKACEERDQVIAYHDQLQRDYHDLDADRERVTADWVAVRNELDEANVNCKGLLARLAEAHEAWEFADNERGCLREQLGEARKAYKGSLACSLHPWLADDGH